MRIIEELNQKNELLNNQINMAKNRLNDVIREIDYLQNEQQNIRNQINLMKEKCSSLMINIGGSIMSISFLIISYIMFSTSDDSIRLNSFNYLSSSFS